MKSGWAVVTNDWGGVLDRVEVFHTREAAKELFDKWANDEPKMVVSANPDNGLYAVDPGETTEMRLIRCKIH